LKEFIPQLKYSLTQFILKMNKCFLLSGTIPDSKPLLETAIACDIRIVVNFSLKKSEMSKIGQYPSHYPFIPACRNEDIEIFEDIIKSSFTCE
jgi:hypothetical protein